MNKSRVPSTGRLADWRPMHQRQSSPAHAAFENILDLLSNRRRGTKSRCLSFDACVVTSARSTLAATPFRLSVRSTLPCLRPQFLLPNQLE